MGNEILTLFKKLTSGDIVIVDIPSEIIKLKLHGEEAEYVFEKLMDYVDDYNEHFTIPPKKKKHE